MRREEAKINEPAVGLLRKRVAGCTAFEIVYFFENGEGTLNVDKANIRTLKDLIEFYIYLKYGCVEQPDCFEPGIYIEKEQNEELFKSYVNNSEYLCFDEDWSNTFENIIEYLEKEEFSVTVKPLQDTVIAFNKGEQFESCDDLEHLVSKFLAKYFPLICKNCGAKDREFYNLEYSGIDVTGTFGEGGGDER